MMFISIKLISGYLNGIWEIIFYMFINAKKTKPYLIIALVVASILILLIINANVRKSKQWHRLSRVREYKQLNRYRLPGEFEKQQAIWMQWPSAIYNQNNYPVNHNIVNIIKAFVPHIRVNLMTVSIAEIDLIKNLLKTNGYSGKNVHYYLINHLSIWTRDVGPIFIKNGWGRLKVVDFGFNNYSRNGNPYYIGIESQIGKLVAQQLGLPVIRTKLFSEGGAIESNGRGALMVTESVILKRNPGQSKPQIEAEYKRVLGVKKIIWLKNGLAEDDRITNGHIDEIARFADPNTILLARVLPGDRYLNWFSQESYRRLEENYKILQKSTDQDGNLFRIIRVPIPPTLYGEIEPTGNLPLRSYLNFAMTNGAVLMQVYWKPGRPGLLRTTEANVRDLFRKVFPGREIIGIDAENINRWGGGIHCITQHMPAD